jgi:hypothetical protein
MGGKKFQPQKSAVQLHLKKYLPEGPSRSG